MMLGKKTVDILDKRKKDYVDDYLNNNKDYMLVKELTGISILLMVFFTVIQIFFWFKYSEYVPPEAFQVSQKTLKNETYNNQKLVSLPMPITTPFALKDWTVKALNNVGNYKFINIKSQAIKSYDGSSKRRYTSSDVENARKYFTKSGYAGYLNSLERIGKLEKLYKNKQNETMTVIGQPLFIGTIQGAVNPNDNKRYWQLEVPILITTTSGVTISELFVVHVMVTLENENGKETGLFIHQMDTKKKR